LLKFLNNKKMSEYFVYPVRVTLNRSFDTEPFGFSVGTVETMPYYHPIINVIAGSVAYAKGLLISDEIVKVDDVYVANSRSDDVAQTLSKYKGLSITLTVNRFRSIKDRLAWQQKLAIDL